MIFKIRIILDAEEDIFRDIEIEGDNTLEDLHNTIQEDEIPLFDMGEGEAPLRLMKDTLLKDIMTEQNPKLIYVYDFLSMWTFFVELADISAKEDGRAYPNLLFSFGELPDSPPEKEFEADSDFDFDNSLESYEDLDFDENWN